MHRSISLIDQSPVPKIRKNRPHTFHIFGIHCPIRIVHIRPASKPSNHTPPLINIPEHIGATPLIKFLNAHRFNILLTLRPHLFFYNVFNRKPVTVPPPPAIYIFSSHSPISRHYVFHNTCYQVPIMRSSRRERRSVIKTIRFSSLAKPHRLLKNFLPLPKFENFFLGVIHFFLGIYFFKDAHMCISVIARSPRRGNSS